MNETRSAMLELILGATKDHVNYCGAQLDIVDYLSDEPMTAEELAVITSTNNGMLYRLLRAAVSTGLLIENDQNQFSVTALGSTLKTGGEQNLLISKYDYRKFKHIVDVGGGMGEWLIDILKKTPESRGTIVDLPSVVEMAKENIESSSVKERCTAVAGDFFTSVPDDGDCYILRFIIHDWDDEHALKILKNVRKSMKNNSGTLLVMERMKEGTDPNILDLFDIYIFTLVSGKERSKSQFEKLFENSSFKIKQVHEFNPSPMKIIEVQPI